jgi:murein DD-endopeptidase MepM/ murein hydrolase activator NlpD
MLKFDGIKNLLGSKFPSGGINLLIARSHGGAFYNVAISFKAYYVAALAAALILFASASMGRNYFLMKRHVTHEETQRRQLETEMREYKNVRDKVADEVADLNGKSKQLQRELENIQRTNEALQKESGIYVRSAGLRDRSDAGSTGAGANDLAGQIVDLKRVFKGLEDGIEQSRKEFNGVSQSIRAKQRRLDAMPALAPVAGGISVESPYGYRFHPITGEYQMHTGVDLKSSYGDPVYSTAAGRVIYTGYFSGYGNLVKVDHENGYVTYYAHLSSIYAREGQSIGKGQVLGLVGQTGTTTGPHLHYEVRYQDQPLDPVRFLRLGRASGRASFKRRY